MKLYSVLFLTPTILEGLFVRRRTGQKRLPDGMPVDVVFEAFRDFLTDIETHEQGLPCTLCPAELHALEDIGSIVALYDPALVDEEQDTVWCAACIRCHDEDPATVQSRMLRQYADYAGGGIILDVRKDHPTPQ